MSELHTSNSTLDIAEALPPDELPSQFIWKVNSRCNLACDYCYVYEMADQSWENQPMRMSEAVVDAASSRVAAFAGRTQVSQIVVAFHGGEPLLAPPEFYDETCRTIREKTPETTAIRFAMQTNGALLNESFLKVFERWGVHVGISLDGGREANDLHRRYRNGRSSYDDVMGGIELINRDRWRHLFSGILGVVDLRNDPHDVYETIKSLTPKADLLLPHGNFDDPPYGLETPEGRAKAPYAEWLSPLFDRWIKQDMETFNVRMFSSIVQMLAGGKSSVETLGGGVLPEIVIETNGEYQKVDTLKSAHAGAPEIGMTVFSNSIEEAAMHSYAQLSAAGATALSETCQVCPIQEVCGGGYLPHRYSRQNNFDNPSIYHEDLLRLIAHAKGAAVEQAIVLAAQRILEPHIHRGYAH